MKNRPLFAVTMLFAGALAAPAQDAKPDPKADARAIVEEAKTKHGAEAIELYTKAIEKDGTNLDAWVGRAKERRFDEPALALADLARCRAAKEDTPEAQYWRGIILWDSLLDRGGAFEEFGKFRGLATPREMPFLSVGLRKILSGQFDEAEGDIGTAAEANDAAPLVHRLKAQCLFERDSPLAVESAQKAVKQAPEDPSVQAVGALVTGMDSMDLAIADLDKIIAAHPKLAMAYICKVKVLHKHSKWAESMSVLDAVDKLAPGGADSMMLRGRALVGQGKTAEAEEAFNRAYAWDPQCRDALTGRIKIHKANLDYDSLIRDLELDTKFMDGAQAQGVIQQIDELKKKREMKDGPLFTAMGFCERAEMYGRNGDFEAAEKDLVKATEIDAKERRIKITRLRLVAKKKDFAALAEATQQLIDDGSPAFSWVFDRAAHRPAGQGPKPDEWFGEVNKDPKFVEWARKLTLKTAEDFYTRGELYYNLANETKGDPGKADALWREAAGEYQTMVDKYPSHSLKAGALYDEACCWSLANDMDKAFDALGKSIDAGFDQVEHMEKNDTDLANMRKDARFPDMVKKLKDKVGPPK